LINTIHLQVNPFYSNKILLPRFHGQTFVVQVIKEKET